jgi:hypothetical protein
VDQATDDLAIKVDVIAPTSELEDAVSHGSASSLPWPYLRKPRAAVSWRQAGLWALQQEAVFGRPTVMLPQSGYWKTNHIVRRPRAF